MAYRIRDSLYRQSHQTACFKECTFCAKRDDSPGQGALPSSSNGSRRVAEVWRPSRFTVADCREEIVSCGYGATAGAPLEARCGEGGALDPRNRPQLRIRPQYRQARRDHDGEIDPGRPARASSTSSASASTPRTGRPIARICPAVRGRAPSKGCWHSSAKAQGDLSRRSLHPRTTSGGWMRRHPPPGRGGIGPSSFACANTTAWADQAFTTPLSATLNFTREPSDG